MLSPVTGFKWPNVKQTIAREKEEEENRKRKEDEEGAKTNKQKRNKHTENCIKTRKRDTIIKPQCI